MSNKRKRNEQETDGLISAKKACLKPAEVPYTPLGSTGIRLVELLPGNFDDPIEIIIKTVDILDNPVYEALSYVWQPHDGTVDNSKSLALATVKNWEDFTISLGANLEIALRYLRQEDVSRVIWIDALSINQEALYERNHQVGLMSKVYSSAQEVIIWLGPPHDDSDFAFRALMTGDLDKVDIPRFMNALEYLLRRDWFTRVWIAQELTLPRKGPLIHHGYQTLDWDTFSLAVQQVRTKILGEEEQFCMRNRSYLESLDKHNIDYLMSSHDVNDTMYPKAVVARAECVQDLASMRNAGRSAGFTEQFFRTTYLKATDPRDRVFGLLGFSTFKHMAIEPDYTKSVDQVFREAAAAIIREDFCSYIRAQLWSYKSRDYNGEVWKSSYNSRPVRTAPSWAGGFEIMNTLRTRTSILIPYGSTLEHALAILPGKVPVVQFSTDYQSLTTMGSRFGRIQWTETVEQLLHGKYQSTLLPYLYSRFVPRKYEKLLSALLGTSNPHAFEEKDMRVALVRLADHHLRSSVPAENELMRALLSHRKATVFATDTGEIGIIQEKISSGESLVLAGLFGIDVPFVLISRGLQTYEMVGIAHVGEHILGDPDMGTKAFLPIGDFGINTDNQKIYKII